MWAPTIACTILLSTGLLAQKTFETPDIDVAEALLVNGVDISTIPELANRSTKSSTCFCSCQVLKRIFGSNKVEDRETLSYSAAINYFYAVQQRDAKPICIFRPEEALDVSSLILLSRLTQCPFAVRSGGHAAFAGASSIDGGITILFERMKQLTLSKDKKIASIQPGNLWFDIYKTLAKDNLTVAGGRVGDIGIGGLVTGGGISWIANQQGWACDNVASYEVVVASGRIVTATPTEFPDLYWALRGGGNNFGIVTKFNLETFPYGMMLGGTRRFAESSFPAAIDAFVNLGRNAAVDTKAAYYMAAGLIASSNTRLMLAELVYTDPILDPPIYEEYRNIPAISDGRKIDTLAHFTLKIESSNPKGFRQTFWTISCKLDRDMVKFIADVGFEEFEKLRDVADILPVNVFQVITVPQLEQMQKNGGNALGLSPSDGPILLCSLNTRWTNIKDDELVLKSHAKIVKTMQAEAKRRDLAIDYVYMNYASPFQDVISSYGKNAEKLRRIALKYDPTEVFQKLQPGYFKLHGPPNPIWP
ncbi:FAD binding domain containing protein [Pyrenophora tritici-repentis Pt-1C-BFP]|nr:FAD binding domain containing protein [Pyrenophora tritici-repentis Pt-1C-BFP]EDU45578.1 FAD binding domain containing protein [Pyrenophora tritici-repentis Pt-1C-BFP]